MKDGVRPIFVEPFGNSASIYEEFFLECHGADVLHGAPVVINDGDLVVLIKWVGKAKNFLEVLETLLGDFEYFLVV